MDLRLLCKENADQVRQSKVVVISPARHAVTYVSTHSVYMEFATFAKQEVRAKRWSVGTACKRVVVLDHRWWQLTLRKHNNDGVITVYSRSRRWQCQFVKWLQLGI